MDVFDTSTHSQGLAVACPRALLPAHIRREQIAR